MVSSLPTPYVTPPNWGAQLNNAIESRYQAALSAIELASGEAVTRIGGDTATASSATIFNVGDWGATGDGVTDDIASLQAAQDAAAAAVGVAPGVTVQLEPGKEYRIGDSLVLDSFVTLDLNGSTIAPHTLPYEFSLVMNRRASSAAPVVNDQFITVKNGTIAGRSSGEAFDECLGYGIELTGADDVLIRDVRIVNIPLSGIEVQGNHSQVAIHGLAAGGALPTIFCNRIVIDNVTVDHVGWQEAWLDDIPGSWPDDSNLLSWGDAGFGVIARSGTYGFTLTNSRGQTCETNVFGVGQLKTARANGDPPTAAHVSDVHFANLFADQTDAAPLGTLSPTYRIAFAARATLNNCIAIGNTDSVGFEVRSASSLESATERIALSNCISEGNNYGFNMSTDISANRALQITLTGCVAKGNNLVGFNQSTNQVAYNGCVSIENGQHGFRMQYAATSPSAIYDTVISGCIAADNGGVGVTDCGILLDDAQSVTVTGCSVFDTRAGGARTQDYGIREIGTATNNVVVGNNARNNAVANLEPVSTASRWNYNMGQAQSVVKPSDTTKNNDNTIAADPHLTINLLPNSVYKIETYLVIDGSNTADFKWNWTIPSGATGYQQADGLAVATTGTTGSMNQAGQLFTATPAIATAGVGTKTIATPQGILITGATGGALTFNWAQSTADPTNTTLFATSALIATRLG